MTDARHRKPLSDGEKKDTAEGSGISSSVLLSTFLPPKEGARWMYGSEKKKKAEMGPDKDVTMGNRHNWCLSATIEERRSS
ncbi:hypothetical protein CDAR_18491 [Caerostris darwini]|uniref:Uncharacterized protein n=1 Tax=Caerostris darwini TaxID=1538125 RepID=A0AAV4V956_9ARAC|nr:hypothetical protein CDAR_18491 [Caerostris darwini]